MDVPIIASGGFGNALHLRDVVDAGADAVAFADALHYQRETLSDIRRMARDAGIAVRGTL